MSYPSQYILAFYIHCEKNKFQSLYDILLIYSLYILTIRVEERTAPVNYYSLSSRVIYLSFQASMISKLSISNRQFQFCWYWTRASLQLRLIHGFFICVWHLFYIPFLEPPLHASPIPRIHNNMVSSNTSKPQGSCCHFAINCTPLGNSLETTHDCIVSSEYMLQNASRFIHDMMQCVI